VWAYLKGVALSLFVNVLTIVGWFYVGMWLPAIANALIALLVVGLWGLEDQWAFPLGYWTVELLAMVFWLTGMSFSRQLSF
jgi:hypothetical protein